jgi:Protein of unknown function (DUF3618)
MGKDVSQVRHEVEAAREEVAEAVEALVYKLNAPKRLKERVTTKVRTAKERTTAMASDAKEQVSARVGEPAGNGEVAVEAPSPVERWDGGTPEARPEETLPRVESS